MKKIKDFKQYEKITYEAAQDFSKKKYNDSLKKFKLLADYNFENLKVHEMLVYNYLKLEEIEKSEEEFEVLLKLAREKNIHLQLKSFDELVDETEDIEVLEEHYEQILEKKNEEVSLYEDTKTVFDLSFKYMAEGKFEEAEKIILSFKDIVHR